MERSHDARFWRVAWWVLLSSWLGCGAALASAPARDESAALLDQLAALQAEVKELAAENQALRRRQDALERELRALPAGTAASSSSASPAAGPSTAEGGGAADSSAGALPNTSSGLASADAKLAVPASEGVRLWGYGEIYLANPTARGAKVQTDLARAVFGMGYAFGPSTEFNSEFEVEHAVASASDVGEFEVEQFYVDHGLSDFASVRAGLFLMPFGLLNEHHEPTQFYGMQRNFVETLIIPSTWREGGVGLHGTAAAGLGWDAGVTTGFDLSKWSFTPVYPPYTTALDLANNAAAPLQATHQELALANGRALAQYAALRYFAIPGLAVGAAITTGNTIKASSSAPGTERATLWEAHLRWTPGPFDLSALYARGAISKLAAVNAAHLGAANPIPSSFYGYYLQGAYELWRRGEYRLAPFARWERYELGASYAGTRGPFYPAGRVLLDSSGADFGFWPQAHDELWTLGANFYVTSHVVLKADYQRFAVNRDFTRVDLGLGVSF